MKIRLIITGVLALPFLAPAQVTVQQGGMIFLAKNAELIVQGDMQSKENIAGEGILTLNGTSPQILDLNSHSLPQLYVENMKGVTLASPLAIGKQLLLKAGSLRLAEYDLRLSKEATASGDAKNYIISDNGKFIKELQHDVETFVAPIGTSTAYTPLLLLSRGTYNKGLIEIAAKSAASPHKPLSSRDYLENYWAVNRRGISGDVRVTAFYDKVSGNEENIQPYYWNGREWINKQSPVDTRNKLLAIDIPEGSGEIYAMRKGDELAPAASSMVLLPNPVKNTATIVIRSTTDENATLRIMDSRGVPVITQKIVLRKGVNQVSVNVAALPNGYYTISSSMKTSKALTMIKN